MFCASWRKWSHGEGLAAKMIITGDRYRDENFDNGADVDDAHAFNDYGGGNREANINIHDGSDEEVVIGCFTMTVVAVSK